MKIMLIDISFNVVNCTIIVYFSFREFSLYVHHGALVIHMIMISNLVLKKSVKMKINNIGLSNNVILFLNNHVQ